MNHQPLGQWTTTIQPFAPPDGVLVVDCVTHRVTSKRGKRMLFLMKMVKLSTSIIGSLGRRSGEGAESCHSVSFCALKQPCESCFDSLCACVCELYTLLSSSAGHHPWISHQPFVSFGDLRQTPVIAPVWANGDGQCRNCLIGITSDKQQQ